MQRALALRLRNPRLLSFIAEGQPQPSPTVCQKQFSVQRVLRVSQEGSIKSVAMTTNLSQAQEPPSGGLQSLGKSCGRPRQSSGNTHSNNSFQARNKRYMSSSAMHRSRSHGRNHPRGVKRHAGDDGRDPRAKRGKVGHDGVWSMSDEFLALREKIRSIPKKSSVDLPRSIETDPIGVIREAIRSTSTRLQLSNKQLEKGLYESTVVLQVSGKDPISATVVDSTIGGAEKTACFRIISDSDEQGLLTHIFPVRLDKIDLRTKKTEKDVELDIYDYAARYGTVPTVMTEVGMRAKRKIWETTVKMPEHKIEVVARGKSEDISRIAAGLKFKSAVEEYHSQQGTETLVVKDATALNAANAKSFFDFYKLENPRSTVRVDVSPKGNMHLGQVFLDEVATGPVVCKIGKKKVEDLAMLVAAVTITKDQPQMLEDFLKALKAGNGQILGRLHSIDMEIHEEAVRVMRETIHKARDAGLPDEHDELEAEDAGPDGRRMRNLPKLEGAALKLKSSELSSIRKAYLENPKLEALRTTRSELPMMQYASQVREIVGNNTYSIIIGATGSGKTTQVPQILLDEATDAGNGASCNIVCTQPRRIAATSVAKRVADEKSEPLQQSVGYHVRFDPKLPNVGGSITYCTTGILLQQLQHSPDQVIDRISHLIIDEVHERDKDIDFLMVILKKVIATRLREKKPVPKVVLMSATMDSDLFAGYFKNTHSTLGESECPTLRVPGRTFPVTEQYLESILKTLDETYSQAKLTTMYRDQNTQAYFEAEKDFAKQNPVTRAMSNLTSKKIEDEVEEKESIIDWKKERTITADGEVVMDTEKEDSLVPIGLVATTIAHIAKSTHEGAILVFVPGLEEMQKIDLLLTGENILGVNFRDETKYKSYMLHSSIPESQTEVFKPVPPGVRKIILATNIAETSITIPDVQYVIDTGKLREKRYDQLRRISKLQCTWFSKSNSKQRAGRAGRVQNGHYYALFSKPRFEALRAVGLPELLRTDLQETCLHIKAQAFKMPVREFLAEAIEPPSPASVDMSVNTLVSLGALTEDEKLTPLGRLLASLPVHPSLGKMIVLGVIFRCLDPMLIIGAAANERSLFAMPPGKRQEANSIKMKFSAGSGSDHVALVNAFRQLRQIRETRGNYAAYDFGMQNFVHNGAFKSIESAAQQIETVLVEAKLIPLTPTFMRRDFQYGSPDLNRNSSKIHIIKALILAGLHPNIAAKTGFKSPTFRTPTEKNTMIHPSSTNDGLIKFHFLPKKAPLLTYSSLVKAADGHSMFMRDTTRVTPLMTSIFGGQLTVPVAWHRGIEMDSWLPFYVISADNRDMKTIIEFRNALQRMLTGAFQDLSSRQLLNDNAVRETFSEGVIKVLDLDVGAETTDGGVAPRKALEYDMPSDDTSSVRRPLGFSRRGDFDARVRDPMAQAFERRGSRSTRTDVLRGLRTSGAAKRSLDAALSGLVRQDAHSRMAPATRAW